MNSIKTLMGGATGALSAQKSLMNVIGKNIANANTPGYSRQRGILTAGAPGIPVQLSDVAAVRSLSIQRSILGASQSKGFHEGRIMALQVAEPALNDLDGAGVSAAMDEFFSALSELSGNPAGTSERKNLLSKAKSMALAFNSAGQGLAEAQANAEFEANLTAKQINTLTEQIASLNTLVTSNLAAGQPVGEYVDQRDQLLKQLANEVDIQTTEAEDGNVSVFLGSGVQLVGRQGASEVSVEGGGGVDLSLKVTRPSGVSTDAGAAVGGRLGGLFEARDQTLQTSIDQLDRLAFDFANAFNAVHSTGFGTDGSTGMKFFDVPANAPGSASQLKLSADVDGQPEKLALANDPTMLPGDQGNLEALMDLETDQTVVSGGKSVFEAWDDVVLTVSSELNTARADYEAAASRVESLETIRASESGVSLEEEMMNLTQAERAFQAASRVVETANELYDALMAMV